MKILFDTNVLVSAFLSKGYSYEVIEDAHCNHDIYYTDFIVREFEVVLADKFSLSPQFIKAAVDFIKRYFTPAETAPCREEICRDTSDNDVLADAAHNTIDVLITGDKDLLELKKYKNVVIIAPKEYWKLSQV